MSANASETKTNSPKIEIYRPMQHGLYYSEIVRKILLADNDVSDNSANNDRDKDALVSDLYRALAQENSLIIPKTSKGATLTIADLQPFKKEGTSTQETSSKNIELPSVAATFEDATNELFEKTNWEKLKNWLESKLEEFSEDIKNLVDPVLYDKKDPATILFIIEFLLKKNFLYWKIATYNDYEVDELFKNLDISEEDYKLYKELDELPADVLLEKGKGVCRHYTLIAVSLYKVFCDKYPDSSLKNSRLYEMSIIDLDSNITINNMQHAALTLIKADKDELIIIPSDPTFFSSSDHEKLYVTSRFAIIVNMLSSPEFLEKLSNYYSKADLKEIIKLQMRFLWNLDLIEIGKRFEQLYELSYVSIIYSHLLIAMKLEENYSSVEDIDNNLKDRLVRKTIKELIDKYKDTIYHEEILIQIFEYLSINDHLLWDNFLIIDNYMDTIDKDARRSLLSLMKNKMNEIRKMDPMDMDKFHSIVLKKYDELVKQNA